MSTITPALQSALSIPFSKALITPRVTRWTPEALAQMGNIFHQHKALYTYLPEDMPAFQALQLRQTLARYLNGLNHTPKHSASLKFVDHAKDSFEFHPDLVKPSSPQTTRGTTLLLYKPLVNGRGGDFQLEHQASKEVANIPTKPDAHSLIAFSEPEWWHRATARKRINPNQPVTHLMSATRWVNPEGSSVIEEQRAANKRLQAFMASQRQGG